MISVPWPLFVAVEGQMREANLLPTLRTAIILDDVDTSLVLCAMFLATWNRVDNVRLLDSPLTA